ncbi:MAG: N-acetyltransferase [Dehalococcoidia bacterium]
MSGEITIRHLRQDDADRVRALDRQILGADRSSTWNEYVEQFLRLSAYTQALPWWGSQVALADGQVVGFVLAEKQTTGYGLPTGVRIVALAVHPEFRRSGVGRRLVEALKDDCHRSGIGEIYSVLQARDERDARFLKSCGFNVADVQVLSCKIGSGATPEVTTSSVSMAGLGSVHSTY